MDKVFCVALLIESKKLVVIPLKWINGLQLADNLNYGIRPHKKYLIFYAHYDQEPVFGPPVMNFEDFVPACYNAYILKSFVHQIAANYYVERRRPIYPVNYAPNRRILRDQIEVKLEKMHIMEKTIISLNKRLDQFGPENLTDDEMNNAIDMLIEIDTNNINNGENDVATSSQCNVEQQNERRNRTYSIDEVGFVELEFSGAHRFTLNESDGRNYYDIGITLNRAEISVLKHLNSNPLFNNKKGDRSFVNWLLGKMFSTEELASSSAMGKYSHGISHQSLNATKLNFIKDLLAIRVNNDQERMEPFLEIVNKKCWNCRTSRK